MTAYIVKTWKLFNLHNNWLCIGVFPNDRGLVKSGHLMLFLENNLGFLLNDFSEAFIRNNPS